MIKSLRTIRKYNILWAMAYRVSFVIQVWSMFLSDLVMLFVFFFFFQKFGTIAGMEFQGYIKMLIICLLWYCVHSIFFAGTRKIGERIVTWQLDSHLLLPKNMLLRIMMSKIDISVFGDFIYMIWLFFLVKDISVIFVMKAIFLGFLGWMTLTGFFLAVESLWFRIGSSRELSRASFDWVLGPAHYPQNIFQWMFFKVLFVTLLPVFFTTYLPYNMLSSDFSRGNLLLLLGGCLCFCGLWIFLFYRGLGRYESGNMMNVNS